MMTRRHFALASAAALASGAAGSLSAAPIPKDFDTVFPQGPVNPYANSSRARPTSRCSTPSLYSIARSAT